MLCWLNVPRQLANLLLCSEAHGQHIHQTLNSDICACLSCKLFVTSSLLHYRIIQWHLCWLWKCQLRCVSPKHTISDSWQWWHHSIWRRGYLGISKGIQQFQFRRVSFWCCLLPRMAKVSYVWMITFCTAPIAAPTLDQTISRSDLPAPTMPAILF